MRSLTAAAILLALAGSAYAQGMPPIGIPMGDEKPHKPVDPVKENEYNSAIKGLPSPKASDPWGNIRQSPPAPAAKKAPGAADKTTPAAKKKSATAKNADAPKKTN